MNIAPFIGAVLGFPFGGLLSDKSILWLSKRNGGIYEPEMELWLALPIAIISPAGILMFGLGLAYVSHLFYFDLFPILPLYIVERCEIVRLTSLGRPLGSPCRWFWLLWVCPGRYQRHCSLLPHGLLPGCE